MAKIIQMFKRISNFIIKTLDNFGRGCKLKW